MDVIQRGKDMRANGLIGITDRHDDVEDRLKGLARVEPLCFPANEDRHRRRLARCLCGCFHCSFLLSLCGLRLLARTHDIRFALCCEAGGGQPPLRVGKPGKRVSLGVLGKLDRSRRISGLERALGHEPEALSWTSWTPPSATPRRSARL